MELSQKSYNELLAKHQGYLYAIISKRIFNERDVEDVVQNCNQYIMSRYEKFDCSETLEGELIPRFKGWIAAFCRNTISKFLRVNKRYSREIADEEVYNVALETFGEEDFNFKSSSEKDRMSEINYTLDFYSRDLSGHDLEIFSLLRKGLNLREVGKICGITHQAVQQVREKVFSKFRRSFNASAFRLEVEDVPKYLSTLNNLFNEDLKKGKNQIILDVDSINKLIKEGVSIAGIGRELKVSEDRIRAYLEKNNLKSPYLKFVSKKIKNNGKHFELTFSGERFIMDNTFLPFFKKFKSSVFLARGQDCILSFDISKKFISLSRFVKNNYNLDISSLKKRGFRTRGGVIFLYELANGFLLEKGQKVCLKKARNELGYTDLRISNIEFIDRAKYSSKYYGVSPISKDGDGWRAKFTFKGEIYELGTFSSECEAAKAYDRKLIEVKGKKSAMNYLNFV